MGCDFITLSIIYHRSLCSVFSLITSILLEDNVANITGFINIQSLFIKAVIYDWLGWLAVLHSVRGFPLPHLCSIGVFSSWKTPLTASPHKRSFIWFFVLISFSLFVIALIYSVAWLSAWLCCIVCVYWLWDGGTCFSSMCHLFFFPIRCLGNSYQIFYKVVIII